MTETAVIFTCDSFRPIRHSGDRWWIRARHAAHVFARRYARRHGFYCNDLTVVDSVARDGSFAVYRAWLQAPKDESGKRESVIYLFTVFRNPPAADLNAWFDHAPSPSDPESPYHHRGPLPIACAPRTGMKRFDADMTYGSPIYRFDYKLKGAPQ